MSNYDKRPSAFFMYTKDHDFREILSKYILYDNDIENKNPTDLVMDLYNMREELDALEDERIIREYLKLAKLLRELGQL